MLKQVCGKITRAPRRGRVPSARPSARPQVEALERREVLTLSPVAAGSAGAFRAVVEVQAVFPDHKGVVGTGALIDGDHVLTAGHILYSAQDGGYATSVKVTPELHGTSAPFGVAFGTFERVDPSWINFSKTNPGGTSPAVADIGLVTLNRPIGYTTGWFTPYYNNNNAFFANAPFITAGYPVLAGANGSQMYFETGRAMGASSTNGIAFHQSGLSVVAGQSGSPLWQTSARGVPVLYGVLTGATGFAGSNIAFASRITQAVYNELLTWERLDRMPPVYSNVTMASQVNLQHPAVAAVAVRPATTPPAIQALDDYSWDAGVQSTWDPFSSLAYGAYSGTYYGYFGNSIVPWSSWGQSAYQSVYDSAYSNYGYVNDPGYWMNYSDPFGYNMYGY